MGLRSARAPPGAATRMSGVDAIEILFTTLLVLVSLLIGWFAGYAVYKLYKGQA